MDDDGSFRVTPFEIAVDSREQLPYSFEHLRTDANAGDLDLLVRQQVVTLPSGDYSIIGYERRVSIERKTIQDLFSTLGHGRDRFLREVERLSRFEFSAVVVEAEWSEILDGPQVSRMSPKSVWRTVIAWQQRHPHLHWNFLPDRRLAEVYTFRSLERFWRSAQKAAAL